MGASIEQQDAYAVPGQNGTEHAACKSAAEDGYVVLSGSWVRDLVGGQ